jgi:sigma-B regulation protein RsbU (phosphoserine phosphatase)
MISALDDLDMLARCIQKGAEDYLGKPFDPVLLRARIGSCLEKKRLHDQEQRTYQALLEAQRSLAAELAEAASYVRALLPAPLEGTIRADWRFIPCAQLGGDAFGYEWLDENCFAVYLLDVCSHGVGAALLSISVLNILRSRALPAADLRQPSDVLAALNRMFSMDSQHNLYFTMWYGVLDRRARRLTYASAGHPPAILFTGEDLASARIERLRTSGPAVGALDEAEFPSRQVELGSFNRLYVFSDGVYEIVRGDGSMMTLDEFVSNLEEQAQRQTGSLEAVLDHIQKARGSAAYSDDVALLELNFNLAAPILRPISPIPV